MYRAGRLNSSADALSRSPHGAAPSEGVAESEVQVASLQSDPIQNLMPTSKQMERLLIY